MDEGEGSNPEDGSESEADPKVTQLLEAKDAAMAKRNLHTRDQARGQGQGRGDQISHGKARPNFSVKRNAGCFLVESSAKLTHFTENGKIKFGILTEEHTTFHGKLTPSGLLREITNNKPSASHGQTSHGQAQCSHQRPRGQGVRTRWQDFTRKSTTQLFREKQAAFRWKAVQN